MSEDSNDPMILPTKTRDEYILKAIEHAAEMQVFLYSKLMVAAWKSFDGRVTKIQDMDDMHLVNALGLLNRESENKQSHLKPFLEREFEARLKKDAELRKDGSYRKAMRKRLLQRSGRWKNKNSFAFSGVLTAPIDLNDHPSLQR